MRDRTWVRRIATHAVPAVFIVLLLICGGFLLGSMWNHEPDRRPHKEDKTVSTSLYDVRVETYRHAVDRPQASGGALTPFGERNLLVTGDGRMYFFEQAADRAALRVAELGARVPINHAAFSAAVPESFNKKWFRVADAFVLDLKSATRLYVSHHYWYPERRCFTVRLSYLDGDATADPAHVFRNASWRTLYESAPCLTFHMAHGERFAGLQIGGRLAQLDARTLLMTLGDHEFDGWNAREAFSADASNPYGKILAIDMASGQSRIFSMGHRNPQGLVIDAAGVIWSTEHGPQGGDELNRIVEGRNYGWPHVTYGTEYGQHVWPVSNTPGTHVGFEQPVYAWVPSPAVSSLLSMNSRAFALWRDDLLIGTLKGAMLLRARLHEGRVVVMEPIDVDLRIRDLMQDAHGHLILWSDTAIAFVTPSVDGQGAALFGQCAGCHRSDTSNQHGIGPNLHALFGRKVAGAEGFVYSAALRRLEGTWTPELLDRFLTNPQAVAPGTAMQYPGLAAPEARRQLIEHLQRNN